MTKVFGGLNIFFFFFLETGFKVQVFEDNTVIILFKLQKRTFVKAVMSCVLRVHTIGMCADA